MDVRCEKCQTEYELDESRLKPGGVTVKCTNCGHMFKIRKRTITNVGTPNVSPNVSPNVIDRGRADSGKQPVVMSRRADSIFDEVTRQVSADEVPTSVERQWLIRLENGEQKRCSELATLQQWIVAGVVTRESLISRTGKTWKRLGDIAELGQYFVIADEARAKRGERQTAPTPKPAAGTMLGIASGPTVKAQAAGGTILPDDEEGRTTGNYPQRRPLTTPPPPPGRVVRTPPMGSNAATPPAGATAQPESPALAATQPARAPIATAQPVIRPPAPSVPAPTPAPPVVPMPSHVPSGNRATAAWADAPVPTEGVAPSGPFVGKLSAIPDEPAFAGRVRVAPGDESSFETGKVRMVDDDDDLLPVRRGSRAGMWMLVLALLVMGGAAGVVYVFVIKKDRTEQATAPKDAAAVAVVSPVIDAAPIVTPVIDAPPAPPSPLEVARKEIDADVEPRLKTAIQSLEGKDDPPSQALRAHMIAQLAQDELDRAGLLADKAAAEALRKDSHQLVLDAATAAQRAFKAAGDDAGANVAMAEVLRLQGKSAKDVKRYLDTARAKADKDWAVDIALADALTLARDGKLDDAKAGFAAIDQGDGKLETSGDVRARYHHALVLAAQNKPADAKPLVDAILAAQPEHAGAKALATKLETLVAKTDPLPPEDHGADHGAGNGSAHKPPRPPGPDVSGGGSYDQLLARANALAESNCTRALELYGKALEQKPNGVEALTGMGYCHIDAKQYFAAFSNFRAALAVSPKYEPALWGVGEAYMQQGLKQQAIDAFRAYLEVYPDSAKAKKALERLGADSGTQTPPTGSGSSGPVTNPNPTPTPTPTPAPGDQGGAGSGSG